MNQFEMLEYLKDNDGSTRDINFTASSIDGVSDFLCEFLVEFEDGELFDQDGVVVESCQSHIVEVIKRKSEGCIHGLMASSSCIITQIRLFIDWPEDGGVAIELSFFPIDLKAEFSLDQFLELLNSWWKLLGASEVFVRYENASWDYYDANGLGVFYHASKA